MLGENIKEIRLQRKYSIRELASLANVSKTTVNEIESNIVNPSIETLRHIAQALDVTITDLLEDNDKYDYKNILQERIKNRRKQLKLTLQELSDKTSITESTLQRYETGSIRNLPIDKLCVLAEALEVPQNYLINLNNENNLIKLNYNHDLSQFTIEELLAEIYKRVSQKNNI